MAWQGGSRKARLFQPNSDTPFKISRSKIDLFTECPRCHYLDARLGVKRPGMPGFTLNIAVDHLLKKEFDIKRAEHTAHPLMEQYGINAVPFEHPDMETWRTNFTGIQYLHTPTNFLVFGAVDDIWIDDKEELMVVDYKATSKKEKPSLEGRWGEQYKRQVEVYQWLLRMNGFKVSDKAYFVYVNGKKDREAFDGVLEFDIDVIEHVGDDRWVEQRLHSIHETLSNDAIPEQGELCEHCPYRENAGKAFKAHVQGSAKTESLFE